MFAKNKSLIIKTLGYLILGILVFVLVKAVDFHELKHHISKAKIEVLLFLIALQVVTQLLICVQWHTITKSVLGGSNFMKVMHLFTKGTVVEAITPGAKIGGEVTRLYYLKKDFECNTDKALSIIVIQKSVSMSVLFSICAVSFIHICTKIEYSLGIQIVVTLINILLISFMIGLLFFSKSLNLFLEKFQNKIIIKINKFIKSYVEATSKLTKKEWIIEFLLSAVIWILYPLKMWILSVSFGIKLPFLVILTVTMTAYFFSMFPITPGGLGTFEGAMIGILSIMDVNTTLAITVSVVFRFVTFWFVIIASGVFVAIYEFILKRRSKSA
ncbi:MAG: lysylphosphatidylglycerol synthase transmembrane domain-containing protein [Clostridia bacterium]